MSGMGQGLETDRGEEEGVKMMKMSNGSTKKYIVVGRIWIVAKIESEWEKFGRRRQEFESVLRNTK